MTYHFTLNPDTYLFLWCLLSGFCLLFIGVVIWLVLLHRKINKDIDGVTGWWNINSEAWYNSLHEQIYDGDKILFNAIDSEKKELLKRTSKLEQLFLSICPPEKYDYVLFELTGVLPQKTEQPKANEIAESKPYIPLHLRRKDRQKK